MIIELLFNLITGVINLIPFELPSLPDKFQTVLDMLFDGLDSGFSLLCLFIDLKFWITCAVAMVIIYNIKRIWNFFVYLLNLIPGVQISTWQ